MSWRNQWHPNLNRYVQINHQSPQAHGLVFWLPGNGINDVTGRCVLTPSGTRTGLSEFGQHINFDNTFSEYLQCDKEVAEIPLTMSCWFRSSVTGGAADFGLIFIGDSLSGTQFYTLRTNNGVPGVWHRAGSSAGKADGSAYTANTWYHYAGVFESLSLRRLVVDGVTAATNTDTESEVSANRTAVGAWRDSSPSAYTTGDLHDIRIYNRALTDEELMLQINSATRYDLYKPIQRFWATKSSGGITLKTVTDSGTTSSSLDISNYAKSTDVGSGVESINESTTLTLSDTSGVVEALSLLVSAGILDSGAVVESITNTISSYLTDTSSALHNLNIQSDTGVSDTSSIIENINVSFFVGVSDTSTSSDLVSAIVTSLIISDTANIVDLLNMAADIQIQESGTISETVAALYLVLISETGVGSDSVSSIAQLDIADTVFGNANLSITVSMSEQDSGTAAEAVNVNIGQIIKTVVDTATASDNTTIYVDVDITESATAVTTLLILNYLITNDVANAADVVAQYSSTSKIARISFEFNSNTIVMTMKQASIKLTKE